MKACNVEAKFTSEGRPNPQILTWEGETLLVIEKGRHWADEDGQHMLVKTTDGRTFELVYNGVNWQGKLVSSPPPPMI